MTITVLHYISRWMHCWVQTVMPYNSWWHHYRLRLAVLQPSSLEKCSMYHNHCFNAPPVSMLSDTYQTHFDVKNQQGVSRLVALSVSVKAERIQNSYMHSEQWIIQSTSTTKVAMSVHACVKMCRPLQHDGSLFVIPPCSCYHCGFHRWYYLFMVICLNIIALHSFQIESVWT